jgi:hypothetical protein
MPSSAPLESLTKYSSSSVRLWFLILTHRNWNSDELTRPHISEFVANLKMSTDNPLNHPTLPGVIARLRPHPRDPFVSRQANDGTKDYRQTYGGEGQQEQYVCTQHLHLCAAPSGRYSELQLSHEGSIVILLGFEPIDLGCTFWAAAPQPAQMCSFAYALLPLFYKCGVIHSAAVSGRHMFPPSLSLNLSVFDGLPGEFVLKCNRADLAR